jgi:hypothetical protein
MTVDEIIIALNNAPQSKRIDLAEELLKKYKGEDKAIVEPWILEMAILEAE